MISIRRRQTRDGPHEAFASAQVVDLAALRGNPLVEIGDALVKPSHSDQDVAHLLEFGLDAVEPILGVFFSSGSLGFQARNRIAQGDERRDAVCPSSERWRALTLLIHALPSAHYQSV